MTVWNSCIWLDAAAVLVQTFDLHAAPRRGVQATYPLQQLGEASGVEVPQL